jgi:hypothetical protein
MLAGSAIAVPMATTAMTATEMTGNFQRVAKLRFFSLNVLLLFSGGARFHDTSCLTWPRAHTTRLRS